MRTATSIRSCTPTAPFNDGHYSNAHVDTLLDLARTQNDVAQRRATYAKMWDQVAQDDPIIYLWTPRNIVGMTKKLADSGRCRTG